MKKSINLYLNYSCPNNWGIIIEAKGHVDPVNEDNIVRGQLNLKLRAKVGPDKVHGN